MRSLCWKGFFFLFLILANNQILHFSSRPILEIVRILNTVISSRGLVSKINLKNAQSSCKITVKFCLFAVSDFEVSLSIPGLISKCLSFCFFLGSNSWAYSSVIRIPNFSNRSSFESVILVSNHTFFPSLVLWSECLWPSHFF